MYDSVLAAHHSDIYYQSVCVCVCIAFHEISQFHSLTFELANIKMCGQAMVISLLQHDPHSMVALLIVSDILTIMNKKMLVDFKIVWLTGNRCHVARTQVGRVYHYTISNLCSY